MASKRIVVANRVLRSSTAFVMSLCSGFIACKAMKMRIEEAKAKMKYKTSMVRWSGNRGVVGKALARMLRVRAMISINSFIAYKGVFFVDSIERMEWLQERGRLLVDLSKVKLKVEMNPNVVMPTLLEVIDGTWVFAMAISVIREEREANRENNSQKKAFFEGQEIPRERGPEHLSSGDNKDVKRTGGDKGGQILDGAIELSSSLLSPIAYFQSFSLFVPFFILSLRSICYPSSSSVNSSKVNKFSSGVASPVVKPNQELKGILFSGYYKTTLVNLRCLPLESGLAQLEDFHIEGISPSKMVSIKSILGSLNVKIIKYSESGV
ncbi:hypothetical protein AAG906_025203 [Vitis piasezkii]